MTKSISIVVPPVIIAVVPALPWLLQPLLTFEAEPVQLDPEEEQDLVVEFWAKGISFVAAVRDVR